MHPNRRGLRGRWVGLGLLLRATAALAHDADVIYVMVNEGPRLALEEVVTLTGGTLSQLAPIDADANGALSQADLDARAAAIAAGVWDQMPIESASGCRRHSERAVLREGYVELSARFECPDGPLSQDFRILRALTTNYRVVLGRQADGEHGRAFAQANVQRLWIRPPVAAAFGVDPSFSAGVRSLLSGLEIILIWLLSLSIADSVRAIVQRWLVFAGGHVVFTFTLSFFAIAVPQAVGTVMIILIGSAYALQILACEKERGPLIALGLLALAWAARESRAGTLEFLLGRSAGLLLLAVLAVLCIRGIRCRVALKRKVTEAVAYASLAALGFSLVQTVLTF